MDGRRTRGRTGRRPAGGESHADKRQAIESSLIAPKYLTHSETRFLALKNPELEGLLKARMSLQFSRRALREEWVKHFFLRITHADFEMVRRD